MIAHGNVEYVFFTSAGFIGLLLEAKKEDIRQGFAQLLIEMFSMYKIILQFAYIDYIYSSKQNELGTWI